MKNREQAVNKALVRQYGEPLVRVVFEVFGAPTAIGWATMTYHGVDFKDCKGKLNHETDGVVYKVKDVTDLNPAYTAAHDALVLAEGKKQQERRMKDRG